MNAQRKSIAVFILMFIALISCGFGFKKKSVTLNTEKYIFFKNCSVEQILSDLRRDEDSAKFLEIISLLLLEMKKIVIN